MKYLLYLLLATIHLCHAQGPSFEVSVPTEKKPWSNLNFQNNPDNFQFAIVSDRTGGMRPGVFPKALDRLNLLHPEFVITVGDLIVGNRKSDDAEKLHSMWDEMEGFISHLDMPFFYLAGNHDNGSPLLSQVWKERFGVEQYHFVYKNVLFLCLNAQDNRDFKAKINPEQQDWAIQTLKDHPDVRWTLVFVHQPVWQYEKGVPINEDNRTLDAWETGWKPIEAALQDRKHTAFAGHIHQYIKFNQDADSANGQYYTLGTTGGGSRLRGPEFGEFDHGMWVTMTDDGPKIAVLEIDGIHPDNTNTEDAETFRGLVSLKGEFKSRDIPLEVDTTLNFENVFDDTLIGHCEWEIPIQSPWRITPAFEDVEIAPGEKLERQFTLTFKGAKPSRINPLPIFHINLTDSKGNRFAARQRIPVDFTEFYQKHNIAPPPDPKKKPKAKAKK